MRKNAFYIGLTLIVISFIASVISFYLLIFGLPAFLIGVILIFQSNKTIKAKLLTTLIPIFLYIPSTLLFLYAYNYSTPKTILIPKDFDGNLRIVYEEKCGNNYDEIDGIKTLAFSKNGILILNESFDRHVNYNYFLVDELGNRTEIQQTFEFKNSNQTKPCVLVVGSGTIGQTIELNSSAQEDKSITYTEFYVYNKNTVGRNNYEIPQKFDSLTTELVNQCRQKNNGSH